MKKSSKKPGAREKLVKPAKKSAAGKKISSSSPGKTTTKIFPIVGIGASAGGLEAFSSLLERLSPKLGMAYIFIQHLSPDHESFLSEIISRKTKMTVHEVKDKMKIEKDHVYVIPPANSLSIIDGTLRLIPKPKGKKVFHPVDLFLSSLAAAYKNMAVGIILSGTATDGTLGLKAIKAEGGTTFAQDDTASYPGMPHSAIEMGYVDFVLSPAKIAEELAALGKHSLSDNNSFADYSSNDEDIRRIHTILKDWKKIDFSFYKQTTIQRRIIRRMLLHKLTSVADYATFIKDRPAEIDALHQDLLINVTDFFRDPVMNQALIKTVFPVITKDRKANNPIRIWIPGCSTGEEAITIAILLIEYLGEKASTMPLQIFATDLNEKTIEKARTGLYPASAVQNISPERLKRFFIKLEGHYQVIKSVREICVMASHNLLTDPPFSNIDMISCQNLLIYLEAAPQQRIMKIFHYALKNSGFLVLGKSETIGNAKDLFESHGKEGKIYTKKVLRRPIQFDFVSKIHTPFAEKSASLSYEETKKETDVNKEAEKLLLAEYTPPALLVNQDLEIIRFFGSVSAYLEPMTGKASLHLTKMVKEEIAFDVRATIIKARKSGRLEKKTGLVISLQGKPTELYIEVKLAHKKEKDLYFLVVFKEAHVLKDLPGKKYSPSQKDRFRDQRLVSLENILKETQNTVRTITEEFESTREELQSSNEEVLSSNEELQSINEELETSKEELQSTNEELLTINEELYNRNRELKEMSDYANAIFETLHEALLILDEDLRIKVANKGFYEMFKTKAEQTEGYHFIELINKQWKMGSLDSPLQSLQRSDTTISNFEFKHLFPDIGQKTILLNAQRLPINEGKESLILLSLQDITERADMEEKIKEREERFRLLIQNAFDTITIYDEKGTIRYISPAVEAMLGFSPKEKIGRNIFTNMDVHPDDRAVKEDMFSKCLEGPGKNIRAEFRMTHKDGSYRNIDAICNNMLQDEKVKGIIANYRDITDRKKLEQQKDDFIGLASHELRTPVTSIKAYAQILHARFEKEGNDKSAEMVFKMNNQIERLSMLISDLLDFTHIESSHLKFRNEDYNLNDLILDMVDETRQTNQTHTIEMKLDGQPVITGDRYRIREVLTNLINNAIKYSPKKDRIIVRSTMQSDQVIVSVKDFGVGIPEEMRKKVFDKFYRVVGDTENTNNVYPGLGLGLYISSEILKKQQGKIWVESEKGKGSEFFFSLPLKKTSGK